RRLLDTRRDLHSVDWREEMRHTLEDALLHVRTRCAVEHSIVATARELREQLEPGSRQAYQLAEIIELIETCRQQHLILERRLMEAPRIFFEEQERQIFILRPPLLIPHPQNDLLAPLLSLPRAHVVQRSEEHTSELQSPCNPSTLPYTTLFRSYQLAEIIELIETCRQQHLILERRLMEAPRIFFEEQERQIFILRPPLLIPHPQNDLLAPLLSLPRAHVVQ